jgi:hypothetical protein
LSKHTRARVEARACESPIGGEAQENNNNNKKQWSDCVKRSETNPEKTSSDEGEASSSGGTRPHRPRRLLRRHLRKMNAAAIPSRPPRSAIPKLKANSASSASSMPRSHSPPPRPPHWSLGRLQHQPRARHRFKVPDL